MLRMLPDPEPDLKEYLDLVAIGTIADIVPLRGVNRTLTKFGMRKMCLSPRAGVSELMRVSGLTDSSRGLSAGQVAFRIAPRLNAAGRMGEAYPALDCLITDDRSEAERLARFLNCTNGERQRIEERILNEAKDELRQGKIDQSLAAFVFASPRWHPGVIGIVASKLAETTDKPCAVIACEGGVGKGSVRTVRGINVVSALAQSTDLLDRFGGHAQAAGFTIDVRRIDEFRQRFASACSTVAPDSGDETLTIDAEVSSNSIDDALVEELSCLEPYGMGNPEPILCARDLTVIDKAVVGNSHLRLRVSNGHTCFNVIGFGMADVIDRLESNSLLAFVPQYNVWNGTRSIQLKLKGVLVK